MKIIFNIILLIALPSLLSAQVLSVSLQECRESAKENWPTFKKMAYQQENRELVNKVLNKNYLPKLTLSGSATYQSEVVEFPTVPTMADFFPTFPNDNYRADLQLTQVIYDGGNTKGAKDLQQASNTLEETKIEVENYNFMEQINKLYLNIILLEQNEAILLTSKAEIEENIKTLQSAYDNGMILLSELNKVKAAQISLEKQIKNTETSKLNLIQSLAMLSGLDISTDTSFKIPDDENGNMGTLPQLKIFEAQENLNSASVETNFRNKFPKLFLFANGGFGRPGYNFMNTDLHTYGMVGIKFSWDVIDWGTYSTQKEKSQVKSKLIEANKEAFVKQNSLEVQKTYNNIANLEEQIKMDEKIIAIKEDIKNSSWSKFQNGTITSNEYLKDFNDLKKSQQSLEINKIQLIKMKLELQHLKGVEY